MSIAVDFRPARMVHLSHPVSTVVAWTTVAAAALFGASFVGTDVLHLQPDLYFLIYFTVALVMFGSFISRYATQLGALFREHLVASVLTGAVVGGGLVVQIMNEAGTPHPDGWRRAFELVWRGAVYGTVDALVLFVFPASLAYLLMRGDRQGIRRRSAFMGLVLALSLVVSAGYHAGYEDYRGANMRYPVIGSLVFNVPTAVTGNPVGSVVAHTVMHTTAVVHQREGGPNHLLPPRITSDYEARGTESAAAVVGTLWLLGTAVVVRRVLRQMQASTRMRR